MILFYLLASLGLMFILKYGSIFDTPRCWLTTKSKFFKELICCSLCLGFWTGVFVAGILFFFDDYVKDLILFPFASAGFCWILDIVKEWFRK